MRYRDFIQNIIITFLALLSLFLFSEHQFFQLGAAASGGTCNSSPLLSATESRCPSPIPCRPGAGSRHQEEYGRYGSISLTTNCELHPHQNTAARGSWVRPQPDGFQYCRLPRSAARKPSVYWLLEPCRCLSGGPHGYHRRK